MTPMTDKELRIAECMDIAVFATAGLGILALLITMVYVLVLL